MEQEELRGPALRGRLDVPCEAAEGTARRCGDPSAITYGGRRFCARHALALFRELARPAGEVPGARGGR